MNKGILGIVGIVATGLGLVSTLVGNIVADKKLEMLVEEKVENAFETKLEEKENIDEEA